jgi:hypothetical protein
MHGSANADMLNAASKSAAAPMNLSLQANAAARVSGAS